MRVLCEPSVYISHLLSPTKQGSSSAFLEKVIQGTFTLLYSQSIVQELVDRVMRKEQLYSRISVKDAQDTMRIIETFGEDVGLADDIPKITRDVNDDYIVAQAIMAQAAFIITLDKDLLDMKPIKAVEIVRPGTFLTMLRGDKHNNARI